MTLGRRLATQLFLLLACLTLTAAVGFWGVMGLRQDFSVALQNYERLRQLYQIGLYLQSARVAMSSDFPNLIRAHQECKRAQQALAQLAPMLTLAEHQRPILNELITSIDATAARAARGQPVSVDRPLGQLQKIEPILRQQIEQAQAQADARKRQTLWLLSAVAGVSILASVALGIKQWRSVMRPLSAISEGVHRVAGARFDAPIALQDADREFVRLAGDFNQMAHELETMYGQLQSRVEGATRSLVQSERLAGVGMLAAGVAHEINNPLAIITGRIELLLAKPCDEATRASLQIALDEAFRCKQIIDRLLTLSRGPSGKRQVVRLDELASEVTGNVRLLPGAGGRSIALAQSEPVSVLIDEGELKQVLLNLLINAIQSTDESGRIDVQTRRAGALAELSVSDNGRGMDRATLDRLFEPFFSARPGEVRGTGLGLTISKAVVESHGGSLEAHSDGPEKGSRFVARLPAAQLDDFVTAPAKIET